MRARRQHRIVGAVNKRCAISYAVDRHQGLGKRCASVTDDEAGGSFLRRCALGEPKVADPCLPVVATRRCVVLGSIIESAIVHRINGHVAVIAPAIVWEPDGLAASAVKKMLFTC